MAQLSNTQENKNGNTNQEEDSWLVDTTQQVAGDEELLDEDSDSEDEDDKDIIYQDLELFLKAIEETQLIEPLRRHKVTLGQLLEFDEQDLINCGIELVGERKKILANIGQMHGERWVPTCLRDLTNKSLLSSPGIYIALNDINKHLDYIGVTFKYLRRQIERNPNILELGKDYVGVPKISSELEDMLTTSRKTYSQLQALQRQIGSHRDNPNFKPANLID